jgi:hypothetical protein
MNINRLVMPTLVQVFRAGLRLGSATFTGGRADIYSVSVYHSMQAPQVLLLWRYADVNLSDESQGTDWMDPERRRYKWQALCGVIPDAIMVPLLSRWRCHVCS